MLAKRVLDASIDVLSIIKSNNLNKAHINNVIFNYFYFLINKYFIIIFQINYIMKDFLKLLINIVTNLAFYGVLVVLFAIVSVVCFALLHILYTLLDGIVVILIPIFIVIGPALLLVFLYLEADEAKNTEKNDNISNV